MTTKSAEFAELPQEQYNYFSGQSPVDSTNEVKPHAFVYGSGLSCPHEAKRTASKQRNSQNQFNGGNETQPPSASARADIFDKYKQYFASGNTPMSQSLTRSERSASRLSDYSFPQPSARRSFASADSARKPKALSGPQTAFPQQQQIQKQQLQQQQQTQYQPQPQVQQQQPAQQRPQLSRPTSVQSSNRGNNAQQPQEPQKPDNAASVRSNASSAKPAASVRSTASSAMVKPAPYYAKANAAVSQSETSSQRDDSQIYQHRQLRQQPEYDERPITQAPPQQQQPQFYFGPGGERASTSTRASEPQVISVQSYESKSERAQSGGNEVTEEEIAPNPVLRMADPNTYKTTARVGEHGMEEIPESTVGDADREHVGDDGDGFSDRSGSDGHIPENAYQQPTASQAASNEPPRRPSYSRMSHSTASVATVSSVHRHQQFAQEYPASNRAESVRDDNNSAMDSEEVYTFKPTINARSRNLASRRPDYGQETSERLFSDSDYVRKGMAKKKNYQELDRELDNNHVMQQSQPRPSGDDTNGVFSRLYTDAQRYNEERAERERQLELQRMRDRGEISDDENDAPERSQETAQPQRPSRAEGEEGYEDGSDVGLSAKKGSQAQKRPIDPDLFDRLAKPTAVVKKFVQIKEDEKRLLEEAAQQAEETRTAEMQNIAAYTWDVPAASFKIADLQRQNVLFVS